MKEASFKNPEKEQIWLPGQKKNILREAQVCIRSLDKLEGTGTPTQLRPCQEARGMGSLSISYPTLVCGLPVLEGV